MIEVGQQVNEVRRQVGTRTIEPGELRTVTISQSYDAPIEDVWDACTNPERLPRWFVPVEGELRLGGRYKVQRNAEGTIERCDPPNSFSATWEYGGQTTWIELRLSAEPDGRTRFELEHLGLVEDERWEEFGPGAVGVGWDLTLVGLASHLKLGEPAPADAGAAWLASEQGRKFVSLSSDRWREASLAAGDDPDWARAAAARTAAAYAPPS